MSVFKVLSLFFILNIFAIAVAQTTQTNVIKRVPVDINIVPFEKTEQGQRYKKINGRLPIIKDAWGYPQKDTFFKNEKKPKPSSPKSTFLQKIYNNLFIANAHADDEDPNFPGIVNCRAFPINPSETGYFKAYFEDMVVNNGNGNGQGFDDPLKGAARRAAACQVLREISQIVKLNISGAKPDILFSATLPPSMPSNALAAASTFFGTGESASGIDNGTLHRHIVTRVDPTPNAGEFDAVVYTGWNVPWSLDLPLGSQAYDFKTVMRHEFLHAMGFARGPLPDEVGINGLAVVHNKFSENLYQNEPLAAYKRYFTNTPALSPIFNAPNGSPSAWFINNQAVYQGVKNVISGGLQVAPDGIRPIFNPASWMPGSSLSHFDMDRLSPPNSQIYVMHPSIGFNETRNIHNHEKEVLCHLGYQVAGLCEGATPIARNDVINTIQPTQCVSFLDNDQSLAGGSLSIYDGQLVQVPAGVTITYGTTTNCTAANNTNPAGAKLIRINGNTNSQPVTLKYRIKDSATNRISESAYINLTSCTSDPDQLICNGDFELGVNPLHPYPNPSSYPFFAEYNSSSLPDYVASLYWNAYVDTCDIVFRNNPTIPLSQKNLPYFFLDMNGSGNYSILCGFSNRTSLNLRLFETVKTKLKSTLIPGQCYEAKFDAAFRTDEAPIFPEALMRLRFSTTNISASSGSAIPTLVMDEPIELHPYSVAAGWTGFSKKFIAGDAYNYMYLDGEFPYVPGEYSAAGYFDNFSLKKRPVTECTGTISGNVYFDNVVVNGVRNQGEEGVGGTTVKLIDSSGAVVSQAMTSTDAATKGNYIFSVPSSDSATYYVVLNSESNYTVSEPSSPSASIAGYQYSRAISYTGASINNKNFGVRNSSVSSPIVINYNLKASCLEKQNFIFLDVAGGVAPYTFSWSNGASTEDIGNLNPGNYTVTVTDSVGNTSSLLVVVAPIPTITGIVTDAFLPNFNNGAINITVSGASPFTYYWTKTGGGFNATTEDITNLTAGTYKVNVVTGLGCKGEKSFIVKKKLVVVKPDKLQKK